MKDGTRPSAAVGLALVVGLSLLWGINWPMLKIGLSEIPPWTFRAMMMGLGGPCLLAIVRAMGTDIRVPREAWWPLTYASMTMLTAWMIVSSYAIPMVTSGDAAILAYSMPAWSALFGAIILKERFTPRRAAGLAVGLAGVVVLLTRSFAAIGSSLDGALLMTFAAAMWGFGIVLHKSVRWTMPTAAVAGWQVTLAGAAMFAGSLVFDTPQFDRVSTLGWVSVAFNIFAIAVLGYIMWFRIMELYPATVASVGVLLTPIVGVALGAWWLGESVGWRELLSLALVVGAIALVVFEPAPPKPSTVLE
jgi:drug/metabolite transporter (DMT)-like permease